MMRGSIIKAVLVTACLIAVAGVAAGCGEPEEKSTQRQTVPEVNLKKLDTSNIEPVPQAPKFKGLQKDVASDIDRIVVAINSDDSAYLCKQGYTEADLKLLHQKDDCEAAIKKLLGAYAGYRLDIQEITVTGGDEATAKTRVITTFKKEQEPIEQIIGMSFKKQQGTWRMDLNLAQRIANQPTDGTSGVIKEPKKSK